MCKEGPRALRCSDLPNFLKGEARNEPTRWSAYSYFSRPFCSTEVGEARSSAEAIALSIRSRMKARSGIEQRLNLFTSGASN